MSVAESGIIVILKKALPWLLKVAKNEWRGALAISIIWLATGVIFIWPIVGKYYEMGTFVGEYALHKGERKTISHPDLLIRFDDAILRPLTRSGTSTGDTVYYYPQFSVYPDGKTAKRQPRFEVGQRLPVIAANYIYTIELERLDEAGADTVAYFKVYRREHPVTSR